jgi:hypothetical protein
VASRRARLDRLIDEWDPQLQRAFLDAVYRARGGAHLDQIVRMLEAGNIEAAVRAVGLNPASFRPFDLTIASAFEAGGVATASGVPIILSADGLRTIFEFDVRNPAAEQWLLQHSSSLIREILADQQQMIREALTDAMTRGLNPRTAALDLVGRIVAATGRREGGLIGLTASQAAWVRNYEAELRSANPLAALQRELRDRRFDAAVRRATAAGEPLPAAQIEAMVRTYRNRALRMRAEAIARTEAMAALHEAQEQSIQQAIGAGIDAATVRFVWRTARDTRVRDIHRTMNGQTRRMGEPFIDGNGNRLRFPGDPDAPPETVINCRCWRETLTDFLANIE